MQVEKLKLGGNLTKGDGFQNGGALIVEKGGPATLLTYIQQGSREHVSNEDVLKVSIWVKGPSVLIIEY